MWNSTGSALLASLSTDVDATGRSYYGETGLYFLTTDASFQCLIQLRMYHTTVSFLTKLHIRKRGAHSRCQLVTDWQGVCGYIWLYLKHMFASYNYAESTLIDL
jgi:hypothetical protein